VENIKLVYFKVYVIIPAYGLRLRINTNSSIRMEVNVFENRSTI